MTLYGIDGVVPILPKGPGVSQSYLLDFVFFVDLARDDVFDFAEDFEGAVFFPALPAGRLGTLAPASLASLKPMAMACFLLLTLSPLLDLSIPCLNSCITFSTFSSAFFEYLAIKQ